MYQALRGRRGCPKCDNSTHRLREWEEVEMPRNLSNVIYVWHLIGDDGGDPEDDGPRVQVDVLRVTTRQVGPLRRGRVAVLGKIIHM